MEHRS